VAVPRSEPFREQACPLGACDGSGWILGPEDVARPCECRESRLKKARVRGVASIIPRKFRGVSFDRPPVSDMTRDFQAKAAVDEVRRYMDAMDTNIAQGKGVWLFGDPGTGKTTLAMLISKRALELGYSVAIYSLPKLLARIRRTFDAEPGGDSYLAFFERLISVDLLHIDDLGAEKRSDWVLEQLYALVNERYESERSILVTTNLDEGALKEQIGSRTVSRLVEMCDGNMVPMHGEDRRDPSGRRVA
jgi:DNA replication protein DnaC